MKLKCLLIFISIISSCFSFAQTRGNLKGTIKNLLADQKLSGAVWSTVSDNGEIVTGADGYHNMETKDILKPASKVQVGSIAKTILATGFLRMASRGLLHLDDPVTKYLPAIPISNPWNKTNPVTIRQLLDHTSGLTDARLGHIFSTTSTPDTPLDAVYSNNKNLLKIQARPGSMYSYSNLGYTILGSVIEEITKVRYENYLDAHILKPLGMLNSSFTFISQAGTYADDQLAYGHFDDGRPVTAIPMYLRPAGQFTTTAEDMGKFLRFILSDGRVHGEFFIRHEFLASIGQQRGTDAYKKGVPFGESLGAYSRDRYGVVGVAKNGNTLGFAAMIYLFTEEKKAFFIAHNMDSETADYDVFNEALTKHMGLRTRTFITKQQPIEKEITNWAGYYVPVITKVQPFGLLDNVFSHTKVTTTKNGALLIPFQGRTKELIYQGKHLFSMPDRTNISHAFYTSGNGDLLITDGVKTVKKVSGIKIIAIATSLLLGLIGMLCLFIAGCAKFIKHKLDFVHHPGFWLFTAILTLLLSIACIATQPFMRLGDRTPGNVLLFISTILIPVFASVSLILTIKAPGKFVNSLTFWISVFVLQFCAVLIANKLMPIVMWQ